MSAAGRVLIGVRRVPGFRGLVLLLRRLLIRVEGTLPRLEQVERAVADIHPATVDGGNRLNELERHMPLLLNAIASFSGAARRLERNMREVREQMAELWAGEGERTNTIRDTWRVQTDHARSINDLWERMETIRRELMIEMRYGTGRTDVDAGFESRIINAAKVAEARDTGLRINLGCGHLPLDGYVNADMRDLPGVDVIATADSLPFGEGEVTELFSAHLVEHFAQEQLERELLPYWASLIRPGGVIRMVLPDAGAMLNGFAEGEIPWEELREVLYGGQEYEGDFHFNMYTADTLSKLLANAGFDDVVVEAEGRRNGASLEMQLVARIPA